MGLRHALGTPGGARGVRDVGPGLRVRRPARATSRPATRSRRSTERRSARCVRPAELVRIAAGQHRRRAHVVEDAPATLAGCAGTGPEQHGTGAQHAEQRGVPVGPAGTRTAIGRPARPVRAAAIRAARRSSSCAETEPVLPGDGVVSGACLGSAAGRAAAPARQADAGAVMADIPITVPASRRSVLLSRARVPASGPPGNGGDAPAVGGAEHENPRKLSRQPT